MKAACRSSAGATASHALLAQGAPEPAARRALRRGPELVQPLEPLADLRGRLRGQRERGQAVDRREDLGVRGLLLGEARAEALECRVLRVW